MKKKFMIVAVFMTLSLGAQAAEQPKNVIFILADDLGMCDVTAYAQRFTGTAIQEMYYETPHLDRVGCKYYLTVTVCLIRTYILSWRKYLQYAT